MSCPAIPTESTPSRGRATQPFLFEITGGPSATADSPTVAYYTGKQIQLGWAGTTYAAGGMTGISLYDPARDKVGLQDGNQTLADGDWVYAQYDNLSQRWVILQGTYWKIRRIQLTADMVSGSCSAKVLAWDGAAYSVTGTAFTVYDVPGQFDAAISGNKGYAIYEPDRGVWEALYIGVASTSFRRIEFTLPSAITATDLSIADCPVVATWYGTSPGDTVSVYNDYGWEADAGAQGVADYRPTDSHWVIMLLPCATGSS